MGFKHGQQQRTCCSPEIIPFHVYTYMYTRDRDWVNFDLGCCVSLIFIWVPRCAWRNPSRAWERRAMSTWPNTSSLNLKYNLFTSDMVLLPVLQYTLSGMVVGNSIYHFQLGLEDINGLFVCNTTYTCKSLLECPENALTNFRGAGENPCGYVHKKTFWHWPHIYLVWINCLEHKCMFVYIPLCQCAMYIHVHAYECTVCTCTCTCRVLYIHICRVPAISVHVQ